MNCLRCTKQENRHLVHGDRAAAVEVKHVEHELEALRVFDGVAHNDNARNKTEGIDYACATA